MSQRRSPLLNSSRFSRRFDCWELIADRRLTLNGKITSHYGQVLKKSPFIEAEEQNNKLFDAQRESNWTRTGSSPH